MGALYGLANETGWDPTTADLVVGTSAGAVIGALTVAGVKPWEALSPEREDLLEALLESASFHPQPTLRTFWPGSPSLVSRALRAGPSHAMKVVAGAVLQGSVSTEPIRRLVREWGTQGWPGERLWVMATDFATGERVAFGRPGAPSADVPDAVAASCAIPGFYRPVSIAGGQYVDGGVHTGTNLDVVAGEPLDLVICLSPLSSRPSASLGIYWPVRALLHQQLVPQVRAVEKAGASTVVLEPDGRSISLIGLNPMSRGSVEAVGVAAALEVQSHLQEPSVRAKLTGLKPAPKSPDARGRTASVL
jgi:NTE family protein